MAIRTVLVDDIDGTEDATTHSFSLDDETWEIELSAGNLAQLRAALAPFIDAGRAPNGTRPPKPAAKTSGSKSASGTAKSRRRSSKKSPSRKGIGAVPDPAKVREWAAENGHQVNAKGMIPKSVYAAYSEATGKK